MFLIHFARAWALAIVKSGRVAEMRVAAATVHGLIDEEMKLHIATCAEAGISEEDLEATAESPTPIEIASSLSQGQAASESIRGGH